MHTEAFEICEYGAHPDDARIRQLFPHAPLGVSGQALLSRTGHSCRCAGSNQFVLCRDFRFADTLNALRYE